MVVLFNLIIAAFLLLAYLGTRIDPATFAPPALFSLAYPVWLVLNLLFVALWLWRKSWWAMLSAGCILLGMGHLNSFAQLIPQNTNAPLNQSGFSIMSYNVRLFDWYNWRGNLKSRNAIFSQLHQADADVICFQEFFLHAPSAPRHFATRDSLKELLRARNVYDYYTLNIKNEQFFGIATFSSFPIVNSGRIRFENEKGNMCIYTDLAVGSDTIRVYNAHVASIRFSSEDYRFMEDLGKAESEVPVLAGGINIARRLLRAFERRSQQVTTILAHAEKSPYPVVLCGDLNDTPVSYVYARLKKRFLDSFVESGWGLGRSYVGKFPAFRIDYILHDRDLESYGYRTLPEELSDHRAILTRITWPQHNSPQSEPAEDPTN